ncbi:enoyl-CoA hydratase-related protein [Psychrobacillus sp. OK032]|uniref:enoyl-CoA hydratase-related protein n=1 Tax=Psychrobacillus sp. OK032 TaxID=1884358 RepID=UPI0008BE8B27|nr:enoyl-CoA hydratase-related protein [Psychrobacillus sp. OK032]SER82006.1 enoyl-CoA hydratase [Psychrobacillus sp. OK032]
MKYQTLKIENEKQITYITIANPPVNALSIITLQELEKAIDVAVEDSETKVIVITGEGKFFSAGANIKEFSAIETSQVGMEYGQYGQFVFNKIEQSSKPVIAMINGASLGGGLELAMASHIRIAAESAKLGLPELILGFIPGFGGTQRLTQLVGREKAMKLILTSDAIDGGEAARIGLVLKSVPLEELEVTVSSLAEKISAKSLLGIRATLIAINGGISHGQEQGFLLESELFGNLFTSEDSREGLQAFKEKRSPVFKNH